MQSDSYVRPMTVRQIFKATFALYFRHNLSFIEIFLIFALFQELLDVLIKIFPVTGVAILAAYITDVAYLFSSAVLVIVASNAVLGRPIKLLSAFRRASSLSILVKLSLLSIPLTILSTLYSIATPILPPNIDPYLSQKIPLTIFFSLLFLSIITFVIQFSMLYAAPIAALEKLNFVDSVRRTLRLSWKVPRRNMILLGFYLLVTFGIGTVFRWTLLPAMENAFLPADGTLDIFIFEIFIPKQFSDVVFTISGILALLMEMFILSVGSLLKLLFYYDARARTENYHHEALAEEMGYQPITEWIPT